MTPILEGYLSSVELCKSLGLWDLENGLVLKGILQHCLPPPALQKFIDLFIFLSDCELDTDWAPKDRVREIYLKLSRLKRQGYDKFDAPSALDDWGTNHPVFYGIQKISEQTWPKETKRKYIRFFTETIFKQHALHYEDHLYYQDVYCFRDYLVVAVSSQLDVQVEGSLDANLQNKEKVFREIESGRLVGQKDYYYDDYADVFWDNAPEIKFQWNPDIFEEFKPESGNYDPSEVSAERTETAADLLLTNEQQRNIFIHRPKWLRDNVRSLADYQQLSWVTIFNYWNFLLNRNHYNHFLISYFTFLTGIRKKRWVNYANHGSKNLTDENLWIVRDSKTQEPKWIEYKINRSATQFTKNKHDSRVVKLVLPNNFIFNRKELKKALNEEMLIRSFMAHRSGPRPYLNNMARAGHNLLTNKNNELDSFILAGQIPIEFQARAAYYTTNSANITALLYERMNIVQETAEKLLPLNKALHKNLKLSFGKESPSYPIGSQLGDAFWRWKKFNIPINRKYPTDEKISVLNQLELYGYWLDAHSFATRPKGKESFRLNLDGFIFHKDKDSSGFQESKLLFKPELFSQQQEEIYKARKTLFRHLEKLSYQIIDWPSDSSPYFYTYRVNKSAKKITVIELDSRLALKLTKEIFGFEPILNRPNAYRHQCASLAHKLYNEHIADALLGHHIDGYYFAAPESSASISTLEKAQKAQEKILQKPQFHLIKNLL